MNITIKKEVFEKYPELKIAFLLAKNIDNKSKLEESKHLLKDVEEVIHLTFNKDTVRTHNLISPWKVAQQEFGRQAHHYHTSVERLFHLVLKKKSTSTPDVLTNLLHYQALREIIPFGADDFSKINGNLTFALSSGKEKVGLFKKLEKSSLYYKDELHPLGAKLDYWKNKKTILTSKSISALVHLEALPPIEEKKLRVLAQETASLIKDFCGGNIKLVILNKKKASASI